MPLRDELGEVYTAIESLSDAALRQLETKLERDLVVVRTFIAVRAIIKRNSVETVVDLDRRLEAESQPETRPEPPPYKGKDTETQSQRKPGGEVGQQQMIVELVDKLRSEGEQSRRVLVDHFLNAGYHGQTVYAALRWASRNNWIGLKPGDVIVPGEREPSFYSRRPNNYGESPR